ncbi:hypothetical protein N7539_008635 [Penicillium diatomitis]|uniref:Subtelomeric hrmA-associated cluster protein AFUB-079030/YDR124W-like helical bundle domain-containing protein n=1 Tax=Penicillium diatomitis TaxID=2819901 RepID=A0A9W9WQY0_9EURO|nr:uncharacterized protein N7539_008635 [Penicillium diatomitis]KAJ5472066.1 hypothetical protein N7539_008635 [Penicillium diatomitis]
MIGFSDTSSDGPGVGSASDGDMNVSKNHLAPLNLANTQEVMKYYESAFDYFLQLNCRVVAKASIKAIEPKKEKQIPVQWPYDPENNKFKWWPSDANHKEPDHLFKEGTLASLFLPF